MSTVRAWNYRTLRYRRRFALGTELVADTGIEPACAPDVATEAVLLPRAARSGARA